MKAYLLMLAALSPLHPSRISDVHVVGAHRCTCGATEIVVRAPNIARVHANPYRSAET
jgi:hypothetical protein